MASRGVEHGGAVVTGMQLGRTRAKMGFFLKVTDLTKEIRWPKETHGGVWWWRTTEQIPKGNFGLEMV